MSKLTDMVATVAGAVKSVFNPAEDARALANLERRAQRIAEALSKAEAELADEAIGAAALDGQDERRAARKDLGSKHETVNRWRAERDANDLALSTLRDRIETREREARELEEGKAEAARKAQLALAANSFRVAARRVDVAAKDLAFAQIDAFKASAALFDVLSLRDLEEQQRNDLHAVLKADSIKGRALSRIAQFERRAHIGGLDDPLPSIEAALMNSDGFPDLLEAGR